ncbi:FecR family protein [Flavivirga jejuensis]|uniref:FecR family protein n=2 Tax=Flavivirga jejuensis TaxID=870487 RepID=A0ABT8WRK4_9FLAO|nr:FecR family protein [Flavivirga jejuensis]MDO5975624.1 FecR family protein [Flavivirga jejuensis]
MPPIIIKFLSNDTFNTTKEELEFLENWIQNPENEQLFSDYIKMNAAIEKELKTYDIQKAEEKIMLHIKQEKNVFFRRKIKTVMKYAVAASVLLVVALTVFLNKESGSQFTEPIIINNTIQVGTDKAILTLENGEEITLVKGTSFQTPNATSNGEEIVYEKGASKDIAHNYLTIPRGGQYHIILADGTDVWLNSESQLKYPVAFSTGETRQVELVYGEAYFDVSSSTNHNGADFKVYHQKQEVQVLGTEFNIKAYKDETNIYTTLVEGKVAVSTKITNQILAPSQQSKVNIVRNTISVSNVEVNAEIAWINGKFILQQKTLKEIMKILSRWYDVEVIFNNKDLEEIRFEGVLSKNQDIEEILNNIKNFGVINNFEINNKTITLK